MENKINHSEYVMSHIESDLATNLKIFGKDYSNILGCCLATILEAPYMYEPERGASVWVFALNQFSSKIERETGKKPFLLESRKVGLAISSMYNKHNTKGLDELKAYTSELVGRGRNVYQKNCKEVK